jgi:hypothetical protein
LMNNTAEITATHRNNIAIILKSHFIIVSPLILVIHTLTFLP